MLIVFLKLGILVLFFYITCILQDKMLFNKTLIKSIKFIPNIALAMVWMVMICIFKLNVILVSAIMLMAKLYFEKLYS
jgi:hypothetical protein